MHYSKSKKCSLYEYFQIMRMMLIAKLFIQKYDINDKMTNGLAHDILVLIALASSEG